MNQNHLISETQTFANWLVHNHDHFIAGEYAPAEIVTLARLCGFPLEVACAGVIEFDMVKRRIDRLHRDGITYPQWERVRLAERGIDMPDFDGKTVVENKFASKSKALLRRIQGD